MVQEGSQSTSREPPGGMGILFRKGGSAFASEDGVCHEWEIVPRPTDGEAVSGAISRTERSGSSRTRWLYEYQVYAEGEVHVRSRQEFDESWNEQTDSWEHRSGEVWGNLCGAAGSRIRVEADQFSVMGEPVWHSSLSACEKIASESGSVARGCGR
jgi:hypothetical protein